MRRRALQVVARWLYSWATAERTAVLRRWPGGPPPGSVDAALLRLAANAEHTADRLAAGG